MNDTVRTCTSQLFKALNEKGLSDSTTVVLVGSSARGVMNDRSDVDILILRNDDMRLQIEHSGDLHLQQDTRSRFLRRLQDGDDYPGWALRFGEPISDPDGWWAKQVTAERESPHWPNWRPKIEHAQKRLRMTKELLEIGDYLAASEELMLATSHVARATLLKEGVFPLSRPELPSQLTDIKPSLARLLENLIDGDSENEDLHKGHVFLQKQIVELASVKDSQSRLAQVEA